MVEWIDRVPEAMPMDALTVKITRTGAPTRRVEVAGRGARREALARDAEQLFRKSGARPKRAG
jgi:tRNA A37 threonylcarbamoyladenosine biosynthesis protein TsaE